MSYKFVKFPKMWEGCLAEEAHWTRQRIALPFICSTELPSVSKCGSATGRWQSAV